MSFINKIKEWITYKPHIETEEPDILEHCSVNQNDHCDVIAEIRKLQNSLSCIETERLRKCNEIIGDCNLKLFGTEYGYTKTFGILNTYFERSQYVGSCEFHIHPDDLKKIIHWFEIYKEQMDIYVELCKEQTELNKEIDEMKRRLGIK